MSNHMHYLRLGASLYVPATHPDIAEVAMAQKYPQLRSVIFDTEDSVAADSLQFAYENLQRMLHRLGDCQRRVPLIFIRVRNEFELSRVLDLKDIEFIDGLVLPKFCRSNMERYMMIDIGDKFYMPVLERDVFTTEALHHIRDFLLSYKDKILSLRIGANDMLSSMGMRRDPTMTIYDIRVIDLAIANIVLTFKPCGFNITGPVWESFSQNSKSYLQQEVALDLANGLFGKTVIHPWQVDIVEEVYKVDRREYAVALKILDPDSPPVFKMFDRFHEKATHSNWARTIIERARIYDLKD
ncbi:ATP/GTP-binding protein [Candidatus Magnetobacterium bavaricum]|uniref:ATP/GTP-binding protein n=1 Tax=Candidatus Magnetobacterium bavaricum TaxID=29290 RepID=A0A0F3GKX1_9BACT|nr:ATP/GTP-binding protein [Candidatus Magnetobacterium bavaricum]